MNTGLVKEIFNQTEQLLLFSPQNFWVHSSCFQNIVDEYFDGGAIRMITQSNRTLLFVEHSFFQNCTGYGFGGSIYHEEGNFKMHSVCCSINCKEILVKEGSFVYSESTDSFDHFQEIDYCSVNTYDIYQHSINPGPISLIYGCISIKSLNLSHEKYISTNWLLFTLSFHDYSNNDIQYSSFVNNTSELEEYISSILCFNGNINCYMCNILKNRASFLIGIEQPLTIRNTCILENDYDILVLMPSQSCYTNFYNCTCQNASSNLQTKINIYNIPSSSFLHALDCLQTRNCVAQYDYLEDLKPYIPPDKSEPEIDTLSYLMKKNKNKKLIFSHN